MKTHCRKGHERTPENVSSDNDCRLCKVARAKEYDGRPENKKIRDEYNRSKFVTGQIWINDYLLKHPCVDCGEADPVVLEFDHIVQLKTNRDVTSMMLYSIQKILSEIAKCEVVCANCHTRRTAKRADTLRWRLNVTPISVTPVSVTDEERMEIAAWMSKL